MSRRLEEYQGILQVLFEEIKLEELVGLSRDELIGLLMTKNQVQTHPVIGQEMTPSAQFSLAISQPNWDLNTVCGGPYDNAALYSPAAPISTDEGSWAFELNMGTSVEKQSTAHSVFGAHDSSGFA